ncbi:hypothetical protein [Flavimarina sp. Hel_I_48]|uniref:hypothetical protein n=1 Tax=Flavimarina sp. Hel_I_48 TaxID=1392488 RepID=UPI0004DF5112|nr:hypothetical protein [Flavimarina sp. Hel_I_48]
MAQDIRELFKNDNGLPSEGLRKGHEGRFEKRLDSHFGKANSNGEKQMWLKIAAVCIVLLTVGGLLFKNSLNTSVQPDPQNVQVSEADTTPHLSDFSPEFKKLEDYYMASINVELAQLSLTESNKDLVDSYMAQLEELNTEYKKLNADLVEVGVNDQTVNTLIDNLKLRLELLFKLKDKLKDLKKSPQGETKSNRI